jgi:hypothetical protein
MPSPSFVAFVAMIVLPYPLPAATAKPVACDIPRPCAIYANHGSGAAVEGSGTSGIALLGASGSGTYLGAGVDGESSNQTGNDAGGTFGIGNATGANPFYGALGYGTGIGLYGETEAGPSAGGAGVSGYDAGGASGQVDYNAGVLGRSGPGAGVLGLAGTSPSYNPFYPAGVAGVATAPQTGSPYYAIGVYAGSNSVPLEAENTSNDGYVQLGEGANGISGGLIGYTGFYITFAGSEVLSGTITTNKGPMVRERGASGVTRLTYGARTTMPQIEDVGEAQLTLGRADVAFDPALADTIDSARGYVVFVTPEGDCKGLYVTHKTAAGFTVRELQGGRSSLSFAYRIVAKPLRDTEKRLAVAPPVPGPAASLRSPRSSVRAPAVLSPEARLRARLGAAGFAAALAERQSNLR